jgi:regulator of nucleoside diphosphate kinase
MPPAITMSTVDLDRIDWAHPDGRTLGVEVVEVTYQPERAGHYHL